MKERVVVPFLRSALLKFNELFVLVEEHWTMSFLLFLGVRCPEEQNLALLWQLDAPQRVLRADQRRALHLERLAHDFGLEFPLDERKNQAEEVVEVTGQERVCRTVSLHQADFRPFLFYYFCDPVVIVDDVPRSGRDRVVEGRALV